MGDMEGQGENILSRARCQKPMVSMVNRETSARTLTLRERRLRPLLEVSQHRQHPLRMRFRYRPRRTCQKLGF